MDDNVRVASGSSSTSGMTVVTSAGVGTAESAEVICGCPEPTIEKIVVEQVLGASSAQRVLEFDMFVPERKPAIEQVIDVFIKDVEITDITVIKDKVIVRGEFGIKVMYVARLPNQPVHAFEREHVRFTRDIVIEGAEAGMKVTSDVVVEFVDYDFDECENRKVHITIVLKVWARVVSTTEMDVYALTPVDEVGAQIEVKSASASTTDKVSASQTGGAIVAVGPENVIVTAPEVMPITPTAGTKTVVSGTVTVAGNVVNIRTGPGTNFPVVTKVKKGDSLTIKEQAFGWYRVALKDGTSGWIASWLVNSAEAPKG